MADVNGQLCHRSTRRGVEWSNAKMVYTPLKRFCRKQIRAQHGESKKILIVSQRKLLMKSF